MSCRHGYLFINDDPPDAHDPVSAQVREAASHLVRELDHPSSPVGAVTAAQDLSSATEVALRAAVDRARSAGRTWRDIGEALGTTRQAAFQKFGHQVDPRTGTDTTPAVAPSMARSAADFLSSFTSGRWEDVLRVFDDQMGQRHDTERLASGWAHLIGMFGRYQTMGHVFPVPAGESTVVDVVVHFEAGDAMIWTRFDRDGKVTGLRIHPVSP